MLAKEDRFFYYANFAKNFNIKYVLDNSTLFNVSSTRQESSIRDRLRGWVHRDPYRHEENSELTFIYDRLKSEQIF